MRTVAWLNKKYKTLHPATSEQFADDVRAELMPLCDQEAAEAEIDRLRAENARLGREAYTWSKAAETYAADAERMRAALAELLACHTESAGFTMSMLADRAEFDAMLQRSQERLEAAVGAARAVLGPNVRGEA